MVSSGEVEHLAVVSGARLIFTDIVLLYCTVYHCDEVSMDLEGLPFLFVALPVFVLPIVKGGYGLKWEGDEFIAGFVDSIACHFVCGVAGLRFAN